MIRSLCLMLLLFSGNVALAQDASSDLRAKCAAVGITLEKLRPANQTLEACKTALEIEKLAADRGDSSYPAASALMSGLIALFVGLVTGVLAHRHAFRLEQEKALHDLDQAVHDGRIEKYPKLTQTAEALALYFPPGVSQAQAAVKTTQKLTPQVCQEIGRKMSEWYFCKGGLLLSKESRDAYFLLARALTHASMSSEIMAPEFPGDSRHVCREILQKYRQILKVPVTFAGVEAWEFGHVPSTEDSTGVSAVDKDEQIRRDAERFKDFVLLQELSSRLRTQLSRDIRGRRSPAD